MKNYNKILEAINRGIKFALDDFEDDELQGQINSKVKYNHGTKEWLDLMNEVIDLGLPSGTLWCKYNLDVDPNQLSTPNDWYGSYYAWGELEGNKTKNGKSYFSWDNYKFGNGDNGELTKYCNKSRYGLNGFTDNLSELLLEDDIAYQFKKYNNLKFHIPTKEQFEELLKYTKNYWVKNYDPNKLVNNSKDDVGIKGLNDRIFEGNGNIMFIPAAGFCCDSRDFVGVEGNYWSSNIDTKDTSSAQGLYFYDEGAHMLGNYRYHGFSIHPVLNLNDII